MSDTSTAFFVAHHTDDIELVPARGIAFLQFPNLNKMFVSRVVKNTQSCAATATTYFDMFVSTKRSKILVSNVYVISWVPNTLSFATIPTTTFVTVTSLHLIVYKSLLNKIENCFSIFNLLLLESKLIWLHLQAVRFININPYYRLIHGIKWFLSTMLPTSHSHGHYILRQSHVDRGLFVLE